MLRLDRQRGEVAPAVDGDALPEDGVQALHLLPGQDAETPAALRRIVGGHCEAPRKTSLSSVELKQKQLIVKLPYSNIFINCSKTVYHT